MRLDSIVFGQDQSNAGLRHFDQLAGADAVAFRLGRPRFLRGLQLAGGHGDLLPDRPQLCLGLGNLAGHRQLKLLGIQASTLGVNPRGGDAVAILAAVKEGEVEGNAEAGIVIIIQN